MIEDTQEEVLSYSLELLPRSGHVLGVINEGNRSIGHVMIYNGKEEEEIWKSLISQLNQMMKNLTSQIE